MGSQRIISFDLDGTLIELSFADSVWLEGIPHLYALKMGLSFKDAKEIVMSEYEKVGKERLEWYNLSYWIEKLSLDISPEEILGSFKQRIQLFPEVLEVLDDLTGRGLRLIIITNAQREFADLEIEKTNIKQYFEKVFSSTSDFALVKKKIDLYRKVMSICNVCPNQLIHIGDDKSSDFEVPRKLGIMTFYLDRIGEHSGEAVISNLKELGGKL